MFDADSQPTAETETNGQPIVEQIFKIKMWDKIAALDKIARHLGMYVNRSEISLQHEIEAMTDEELELELIRVIGSDGSAPTVGQTQH